MKRSRWKGLYAVPKDYKTFSNSKPKISRSSSILPKFVGSVFQVHNGKTYKEITITKEMLGHKFGEFSKTRGNFTFKKKNN